MDRARVEVTPDDLLGGMANVLRLYAGHRVAVDTVCRTYTGRLQWNGEVVCVQEDDRTISWIKTEAVTGCRVFPKGPRPTWTTDAA